MRIQFSRSVVQRLIDDGAVSPHRSILAVCAGEAERGATQLKSEV